MSELPGTVLTDADLEGLKRSWIDRESAERALLRHVTNLEGAVRVVGTTGAAHEPSKPRAITFAIARALGIPVDSSRVSIIDAAGARRRLR
jgi:hypothetical protein